MLIGMRQFGGKWFLGIFAFIIIVSFAFWGIGDVVRGLFDRTTNAVAHVGDVELTRNQLSREFRGEMTRMQSLFGGNLDSATARDLGLVDRVVDGLIARTIYNLEAERMGLLIGDDLVRNQIVAAAAFHNSSGAFDENVFAAELAARGFSEPEFVGRLRDDIKRVHLAGSVATAVPPNVLVKSLYRHRQQRRVAEYFVVANASMAPAPTPDGAELAAYHEENAGRFTAPEYRALTVVHVTPKDLVDEVAVAEEEVLAEYNDRRAMFAREERRTVDQILVPDEATATAAHDQLTRGRDFLTVANEVAGTKADDVSLGAIARGDLTDEAADVVFGMARGEISAPTESPFGWHIFRVVAIGEETFPPLTELRAKIEGELALRDASDVLFQLTNTLDDMLAGGTTLEEAAGQLKLRLIRVAEVDSGGTTPSGTAADLPDVPELLAAAFATPAGDATLLTEAANGSYFIARVDGITPPALKRLDRVRDEVAAAWGSAELDKAAAARAATAVERIQGGEAIASVATDMGFTTTTAAPLRRDGNGAEPAFRRALVTALFALNVGGATTAAGGDGHVVARLTRIVDADPNDDKDGVTALGDALRDEIAGDLAIQYRASLQERFPVSVNQRAIDSLF